MLRTGFIGLGLMGVPMCRRLLAAGHELTVWNRSAGKCAPLAALGARVAATPAALAAQVDVVMLCVADTAAVQAVVQGADGVAAGARAGTRLVDFSSIDPAATRVLAAQLAPLGVRWVDAPVSGGVPGATAGTLAIMAGGDAADVDALRPLLAVLGQRVTHMGPVGSGQVSKICNQMIVGVNALVIAEAVALARKAGVDAARLPQALAGGFADSLPLQLLAPRMAAHEFLPVQWKVRTLLKDLDMARALAAGSGATVPVVEAGAALMRAHGDAGHLDDDPSTFVLARE